MRDKRDIDAWVVDRNGDGFVDDVDGRIRVNPPGGRADRAFWSRLIDLSARIGLETHALPYPLVVPASTEEGDANDVAEHLDDIPQVDPPRNPVRGAAETMAPNARCLSRLFSVGGALLDRDEDLLPDASCLAFAIPDALPTEVGCALANLAARLGMESGGITFPLVREPGDRDRRLDVLITDEHATLSVADAGWRVSGSPETLATLLNVVAAHWPHITAPETGGVGSTIARLRRWLAGDGPEPHEPGEVVWEREWSDAWEADRLIDAISSRQMPASPDMDNTPHVQMTAFLSEDKAIRDEVADRIRAVLAERGYPDADIRILSAFKTGLSWLRDEVIPSLVGQPVDRVHIRYTPCEHPTDANVLDSRIRWLQELFPGPELMAAELGIPLASITVGERDEANSGPVFSAEAWDASGNSIGTWECNPLQAQRPFVEAVPGSGQVVVTTGGAMTSLDGRAVPDLMLPTDLEMFWQFWQQTVIPDLLRHIESQGGARAAIQPFFSELFVEVWISEPNEVLGLREENVSAAEALAEDLYFTTLDAIELYGKATTGERVNAPGAIVPIVHVTPRQAPRARVVLRAAPAKSVLPYPDVRVSSLSLVDGELVAGITVEVDGESAATNDRLRVLASRTTAQGTTIRARVTLDEDVVDLRLPVPSLLAASAPLDAGSDAPPMDVNIWGERVIEQAARLVMFPEVTAWVEDESYQGRPIAALALRSPTPGRLSSPTKLAILKPTHLIVARHHANEISSTNAAFRLAWNCANDPRWRRLLDRVNIVVVPEENPDGAALHVRLSAEPEARTWKHHAARYNALGFEFSEAHFDPDTRYGESRARTNLWRRWPADVIVDNHGVPSHEWVQPFAGFGSPPRFAVSYWIVQALLYGIARWVDDDRYPEHRRAVEALRQAVSAAVRDTDIGAWNQVYWESYHFWGQSRLPERFPGDFRDGMLWHIDSAPANPEGRSFTSRFPKTTVLSWVTEVNDETAEGEHLERVARAHLLANQATLTLMFDAAPRTQRYITDDGDGRWTVRVGRDRPLSLQPYEE